MAIPLGSLGSVGGMPSLLPVPRLLAAAAGPADSLPIGSKVVPFCGLYPPKGTTLEPMGNLLWNLMIFPLALPRLRRDHGQPAQHIMISYRIYFL